jgi:hypothetical protein
MKTGFYAFLFLILFVSVQICNAEQGKVRAGTVVIFVPDQDKFIVAADSRGGWARASRQPSDNWCKISVLEGNVLFATSGYAAYDSGLNDPVQSWTNRIQAEAAVHAHQSDRGISQTIVISIADAWAQSLSERWAGLNRQYPELVAKLADKGAHVVTSGVFAMAKDGNIAFAVRELTFIDGQMRAIDGKCGSGHVCGTGHTDVMLEFTRRTSDRARSEFFGWSELPSSNVRLNSVDRRTLYLVRLVDLTIAYDPSGTVGGPIDAVELWQNGSVHWVQRKEQCPGF